MKGLTVSKPAAPYTKVDDLERPVPGPGQVLVKSIYTAMNPVDGYMQGTGLLVTKFPIVLGCDAGGKVEEVGDGVTGLKVGDGLCGCTRLGIPGYATFQEYYLMDEKLAIKVPKDMKLEEACCTGVGSMTASLGIFKGLHIDLPDSSGTAPQKDEWVVILGGTGSVGQYAIQLAKIAGYKVITSCSPSSEKVVRAAGADAFLNYKDPLDKQLEVLKDATNGGNFCRVFDTAAANAPTAFKMLLEASAGSGTKYFTTTDDWTPMDDIIPAAVTVDRIALGIIGRSLGVSGADSAVDDALISYVPLLSQWLANGKLKANEYVVVPGQGMDALLDGIALQNKGARGGKKYVVKVE